MLEQLHEPTQEAILRFQGNGGEGGDVEEEGMLCMYVRMEESGQRGGEVKGACLYVRIYMV